MKSRPDLYLDEIQDHLAQLFDVYVGLSTLWDNLTELGLRRKRVSLLHVVSVPTIHFSLL